MAQQCPTLSLHAESLEEATIWCEDLDTMIIGVGDVYSISLVDHDAAGLPELPHLPPFLTDSDGSSIGAGFNRGQGELDLRRREASRLQRKHTRPRPLKRVMGSFITMNSARFSSVTANVQASNTTRRYSFP